MYKELIRELCHDISKSPKPFPGDYPTRIRLTCTFEGRKFDYCGKPVPEIFARFHREVVVKGTPAAYISLYEVDQNGSVLLYAGGTTQTASFLPLYFPIPSVIYDLDRVYKLFIMLNRKHVRVGKKPMWVIPSLFGVEGFELYDQFVMQSSKGRVRSDPTDGVRGTIVDRIIAEYEKTALTAPKRRTVPPRRPTPDRLRPTIDRLQGRTPMPTDRLYRAFVRQQAERQAAPGWAPPAMYTPELAGQTAPPQPPRTNAVNEWLEGLQQTQLGQAPIGDPMGLTAAGAQQLTWTHLTNDPVTYEQTPIEMPEIL